MVANLTSSHNSCGLTMMASPSLCFPKFKAWRLTKHGWNSQTDPEMVLYQQDSLVRVTSLVCLRCSASQRNWTGGVTNTYKDKGWVREGSLPLLEGKMLLFWFLYIFHVEWSVNVVLVSVHCGWTLLESHYPRFAVHWLYDLGEVD